MVATAGSMAKHPSKNVATMPPVPQTRRMMLSVLRRNQSEKTLMVPISRSSASTRNHATDLGVSPALVGEGFSNNHGKHNPTAMMSQITEEMTPPFPFDGTLDTEKSWLDSRLLVRLSLGDTCFPTAMTK